MMPLRCWNGKIADLYAASDVFFEDFGNDAFNVCPAVVSGIVLNSFRESSVTKILVELIDQIGGYALSERSRILIEKPLCLASMMWLRRSSL